jgi:periplasmic protein CpxP/Spy
MKKTTIALLLASTFVVASSYAQSPATSAAAARTSDDSKPAMKAEAQGNKDVEKHIAELHAKLKITSAQEPQWVPVAKTMRDNANEIEEAIDKREAADGTAIDDLNAYGAIVQAHADGIKKLAQAFSSLYASMPDNQKKIADGAFVHHAHEGKQAAAAKQ